MVPPDAQSQAIERAWAAGFFDGEGCTTLARQRGNVAVRLIVPQKDIRPLERFHRAVGGLGRIYPVTGRALNHWTAASDPEARTVLDILWPYLSDPKREQALRCIAQSTWHDGGRDRLVCRDPDHVHVERKPTGRRCATCLGAYNKAKSGRRLLAALSRDGRRLPRTCGRDNAERLAALGFLVSHGDGSYELTGDGRRELELPVLKGGLFAALGGTTR